MTLLERIREMVEFRTRPGGSYNDLFIADVSASPQLTAIGDREKDKEVICQAIHTFMEGYILEEMCKRLRQAAGVNTADVDYLVTSVRDWEMARKNVVLKGREEGLLADLQRVEKLVQSLLHTIALLQNDSDAYQQGCADKSREMQAKIKVMAQSLRNARSDVDPDSVFG